MRLTTYCAAFLLSAPLSALMGQEPEDIRELKLKDWFPTSMLVTKVTDSPKPAFPAIDVHNHLGGGKESLTAERIGEYLEEMNAAGVRTVVNLDGGWDTRLRETLAALDEAHPGRFLTFALVNFDGIDDPDWTEREVQRLEEGFQAGAKGLKFHKSLGLTYRYKDGRLMPVDDPKLAPIFELCAKYHCPVVIHTADPAAFFTPLDRYNERWHELNEHPNWLFYGAAFPEREELLKQFVNVVARHPNTTFIGAHFGNNVEDLATVGRWLDAYPNLYVDIDARISELGRQPYTARKFIMKYQDRILFGTDTPPRREAFRIYYRFLETEDEYFDCAASHHLQGFWRIYGIHLPPDVLRKIYHANAERILFPFNQTGDSVIAGRSGAQESRYRVARVDDFEVNGHGDAEAWNHAEWATLADRATIGAGGYASRFKVLYSQTGMYVLFHGDDKKVTATMNEDFADLWNEDVFEVFLWPDETQPVYFEYEISPLGYELPIIIPNLGGKFLGWRPWHYSGGRKVRKAVRVQGGRAESDAAIDGWTAEVFIPYALLEPLGNVPPRSGSFWRANFYRMDYDDAKRAWHWAPVGDSFHEFEKFGTLVFE